MIGKEALTFFSGNCNKEDLTVIDRNEIVMRSGDDWGNILRASSLYLNRD